MARFQRVERLLLKGHLIVLRRSLHLLPLMILLLIIGVVIIVHLRARLSILM